jgi:SAM-dependent methyltransferase
MDIRLLSDRFPRSNEYHPGWVIGGCSGGANPLWLTEWLTSVVDLSPGMRVLDLGCGREMSSIFLSREFGVKVWAADLWFSASENLQRIRDAGLEDYVYPIHADARSLPFADDFFDVIVSIDSFPYYGTDDHYLNYVARFVKPGGTIGIAGAGLMCEMESPVPDFLAAWWEPSICALHSATWWHRHWEKSGILDAVLADSMPDGWQFWLQWQRVVAPENLVEIRAVESDRGSYLGYIRAVGRRRPDAKIYDVIQPIPASYDAQPLLRRS